MFIKLFFSLFVMLSLVASSHAKSGCDLSQTGDVKVSWKAYKMPLKVGVGGVFDKVKYISVAPVGPNFRSILVGSKVKIDTSSVNSKNSARDDKLTQFFFEQMSNKNIVAKIVDIKAKKVKKGHSKKGIVIVKITMNSKTKKVPMKYSYKKNIFKASGVIDILDFGASKALSQINKACYEPHQGKTWSDVNIEFSTKIKVTLCK